MSSTNTSTITPSTPFSAPPTSTDSTSNLILNPGLNGPSVYLYGFLATLIIIFLVSICVAWRGYRVRRALRARIDDAIARGVLVPGYDPENPTMPFFQTAGSGGRGFHVLNRPVMYEEWIVAEGEGEEIGKPTSLDALRPYDPPPPPPPTARPHRTSPFSQLHDVFREYWFVRPRPGTHPTQFQGRPGRRGNHRGRTDTLDRSEEGQEQGEMEEKTLDGVREVRAGVLIAMPDRTHPHWGDARAGVGYPSGNGGYAAVPSGSRPSSWQPQQGAMASGSRPTTSSAAHPGHRFSGSVGTAAAATMVEERRELPELVLGVVGFGVEEKKVSVGEDGKEEGSEGLESGKGKEVERTQPEVVTL